VTLGCNFANQIKKEIEKTQTPKVVTATDNKCQLTVPGNWQTRTDLHEEAALQTANLLSDQYAIVISESKADFNEDILLEDYTDLLKRSTKMKVSDVTFTESKLLEINGYPASQYEAEGSVDKIKIKWIFTVINAPKHFHQVVAWTTPSRFEQNKPVLTEVINSFKELSGTATSPEASKSPGKK